MTAPRVLALLPFLVKGALSIDIFRALRARGVQIAVAFCDDASSIYEPDQMADFEATGDLIDLTSMVGAKRLGLIHDLVVDRKIDLVLQVGATDLYHLLPYLKERLPQVRIADILYNEFGHTLNHFLYEGCIDAVIVESDFMRAFVKRSSCKPSPSVEVVYSGVDLAEFSPSNRTADPRLKIGYVGRMSDEKNPLGFIGLAEGLGRKNATLNFEMFGAGGDAAMVKARAAKSDIAERLTFHGFVAHSRDALRQLDVLILPSKFDGRPVILMEANACGVPVIAAPVGGIPEQVQDGISSFLIPPTDVDRIHALISEWQEAPQLLEVVKRAARTHAEQNFSREKMIARYEAAFTNVAAGNDQVVSMSASA